MQFDVYITQDIIVDPAIAVSRTEDANITQDLSFDVYIIADPAN